MLRQIFIASSVIVVLAIALKRRPMTATTVFGLGTLLYGLPLFYGRIDIVTSYAYSGGFRYAADLEDGVYAVFLLCHLAFFVANFIDNRKAPAAAPIDPGRLWLYALLIALTVAIVLFLVTAGRDVLFMSKGDRIVEMPVFYMFAAKLTVCTCVYQALYGTSSTRKFMVLPLAFGAIDLALGYRTTVFLGAISVALAYYGSKSGIMDARAKLRLAFAGVMVVLLAFIYKPIYFALEAGEDVIPGDFRGGVDGTVTGSEPFVTVSMLNEVLRRGVHVPADYLRVSVLQYLPFFELGFGQKRVYFNQFAQPALFPETEWGLSSTAFGELYVVGGFVAVVLFLLALVAFMNLRPPRNPYLSVAYYFMVPYCLFYFHRNDWHGFLSDLRVLMMCALVVAPTHMILKVFAQAPRRHTLAGPIAPPSVSQAPQRRAGT